MNKNATKAQSFKELKRPDPAAEKSAADNEAQILREPIGRYLLESSWSFWFYKSNPSGEWTENLILLCTVKYVEEFWSVYCRLKSPELLSNGCDYMLFKEGIKPMWEDPENVNGERLQLTLKKSDKLNKYWLDGALSLIGSHYWEGFDFIKGLVLNVRPKVNRFALWIGSDAGDVVKNRVGSRFLRDLGLTHVSFYFAKHKQF
jgi:translation initiation factor 4E